MRTTNIAPPASLPLLDTVLFLSDYDFRFPLHSLSELCILLVNQIVANSSPSDYPSWFCTFPPSFCRPFHAQPHPFSPKLYPVVLSFFPCRFSPVVSLLSACCHLTSPRSTSLHPAPPFHQFTSSPVYIQFHQFHPLPLVPIDFLPAAPLSHLARVPFLLSFRPVRLIAHLQQPSGHGKLTSFA